MDELIAALISSATIIIGAIATYIVNHLTKKSINQLHLTNNYHHDKVSNQLDTLERKLITLEKQIKQIETTNNNERINYHESIQK